MVKFFESNFSYDYQWPAVTLAYYLRYPNPYSTHVVSSDTLASSVNPETGNLHITRLHLKRGKLPASVARFIPKIKESYILERSIVDIKNQRLLTESRNLDWDGVLSVVENQEYVPSVTAADAKTDVRVVVKFESRLGRKKQLEDGAAERGGWLKGWGTGGVRASLEVVGRSRMKEGVVKQREGIKLVLEQLRERGFVGVIKEQRQGGWERWKKVWRGAKEEGVFE